MSAKTFLFQLHFISVVNTIEAFFAYTAQETKQPNLQQLNMEIINIIDITKNDPK